MKKQNILLVLDETERSMIVEALHNYLHYHFLNQMLNNIDSSSKHKLLTKINNEKGGFRLIMSEENIFYICKALMWNAKFVVSEKERNSLEYIYTDYMQLATILENRNKHIYLFKDLNPKNYNKNTELKLFTKFDFKQKRILIIRFENDEMEYVKEFYRNNNETDEEYIFRANKLVMDANSDLKNRAKKDLKFLNFKYKAVEFNDILKYKLKKDCSYHV